MITDSLEPLIRSARHVTFNQAAVGPAAESMAGLAWPYPYLAPPEFLAGRHAEVLNWLFIGQAANFNWWLDGWGRTYGLNGAKGEDAMWRALAASWDVFGRLESLSRMDPATLERHLPGAPLAQFRAAALNEAGAILLEAYDGEIVELFSRANWSARLVLDGITGMFSSFSDRFEKHLFYARAQRYLGLVEGYLRAVAPKGEGEGDGGAAGVDGCAECVPAGLADLSVLTVTADNQVPRALVDLGLISYSPKLAGRIAGGRQIDETSPEELELRAQTVHAGEELLIAVNGLRRVRGLADVTAPQLDRHLREAAKTSKQRAHLTQTVFY
ncbi:MAG: queuosine salvage family protein [Bacillota bacterium]